LIQLADTESNDLIFDCIRGMTAGDVIRPEEAQQLFNEGILKDTNDYFETREMAHRVLQHLYLE
jgi:hypothetical protein